MHFKFILGVLFVSLSISTASPSVLSDEKQSQSGVISETEKMEQMLRGIISDLSLKEKIAQLQGVWIARREMEDENAVFLPEKAEAVLAEGIGHIARPAENIEPLSANKSPEQTVKFINDMQSWLLENTRSKIPAMFHGETLHGHMAEDATVFPQSLGIASTWNLSLIAEAFSAIAKETRARGVAHALSPVLDVAKDARWGRIEETYGEDPYLVSAIGMEVVRAMQGGGLVIGDEKVLVTLKHLAGHGYPMGGQNIAPAMMGERYLREQLLTPFEQVIRHFDVASVMASYNEIDGVPSHANSWLLKNVLRDEWGFKGTVISDYFAIDELATRHGLAEDLSSAGILAFKSGVDIELPNPETYGALEGAIGRGEVSLQDIDDVLFRVLRDKYRVELFDSPLSDPKKISVIGSLAHKKLSEKVAEESIVLLKNKGILPLRFDGVKKVALIGPHVDELVLGGYSDVPSSGVTLAEALADSLPLGVELVVEPGMRLTKDDAVDNEKALQVKSYSKARWNVNEISLVSDESNEALIARAKEVAAAADLVILAVGDNEGTSREGWKENHLGDRSELSFAGSQPKLISAVIAAKKPIVTVLLNGRPPELSPWIDHFDALLEAWYPGEQGGTAIANVLHGKVNPSGKLPLSFPRSAGQIPAYYNVKPSANRGYIHEENGPLFAFGFGLSYTDFRYSNIRVKKDKVSIGDEIVVSFDVENTGERFGHEVAQLYIRDPIASVTRPVKELKGFSKVALKAGEKKNLSVRLAAESLYFWGASMKRVVEKGDIDIMVGAASDDIRLTTKVTISDSAEYENAKHLPYFSHWKQK